MRAEREFEAAAAKGLRPCKLTSLVIPIMSYSIHIHISGPTCKKMCDFGKNAVFLSLAFQPTSDDLKRATRRKYPGPSRKPSIHAASIVLDSDGEEESSSDEDFPDISTILKNRAAAGNAKDNGKGKAKANRVLDSDDDDEVKFYGLSTSTVLTISQNDRRSKASNNGKQAATDAAAPSRDVIRAWREGGENLEPSAKMLALIGFLQEADSSGDKTICFSQCSFLL